MSKVYRKLKRCVKYIRSKTDFTPRVALVLGSGLGDYADDMTVEASIDYHDIDEFPVSTVPGHRGRFAFGYIGDVPVVILQGRVHYYEGYPVSDVVLPVRLAGLLGASSILLTNSSGAINTTFSAGDFMLITDHIAYGVPSPLIGKNIDELGTRFPDMSSVYDKDHCDDIRQAAASLGISLQEGVYIQTSGPNFETPAEIRAYGALGADVVGMSTACEAVAAVHMGMKVSGISCVSNLAAGISENPLTHAEVMETADRVAPDFKRLITDAVTRIGARY